MKQKRSSGRLLISFILACLLMGLAGTGRAPVHAAPLLQTGNADLQVTMTVSNATPNKTDAVIFTITVQNLSTTESVTGVTVQVSLPAGITYVSDNSGGTYDSVSGSWVVGSIAPSGSVSLGIVTNVTTTGLKTNTATILTSSLPDPVGGNNLFTVLVTPKSSDVGITMSVNNSTPSLGDVVTFSITASNAAGSDNASSVKVIDILPAGLTFISYTSTSGTYTSSTGNWSVGSLTAGGTSKTLNIMASVSAIGTITNTAQITDADQLDPDATSNTASQTLTVPSADLAVFVDVNNPTPNKADAVVFTIRTKNNGSVPTTGVTVKDLLPAGLTYQSHSGGAYNSTTGVWLIGSLPAGAETTLTITTRATTTGAKVNTVSILTSNQADANASNNSASVTVTPKAADLSIVKTIDKNAPNPGDTVTFKITMSNAGPDTATNVSIKDVLPAGYENPTYSGGSFDTVENLWSVASLDKDKSATLTITATVTTNSDKTNKAEIWASDQLDPDSTPQNNSNSEDDDDAAPKVNLSLSKTVGSAVSSIGSDIVFNIKVSNVGVSAATGVVVRDILPPGLSFVSHNGGTAAIYNSSNGTILWQVGTLTPNTSKTLTITMRSAVIGAYTNYAEVWTCDQYDTNSVPGNGSTAEDDDEQVTVTISYPALSILINEVAWAGTAASVNDEWMELYNPGTKPINLTGWTLKAVDGTPNIPLLNGYILQPGEYFLLERTDDTTVSDIVANQIYTGELGNTSEVLQLLDPLNRVVDTANTNGGYWPAGSSTTYGSMERRAVVADTDTAWLTNTGVIAWGKDAGIPNDCTTTPPCLTAPKILKGTPKHVNWAVSVPAPTAIPPYSTKPPAVAPPPLVAINEFVPRPGHDWNGDGRIDTGDEYIELINHGVINVNLSGYRLDDEANIGSATYSLPSVTLKPGQRIVFYGSQTGLLLSDGGDGVRLLKPNGQLMDAFNYTTVGYPDQAYCRLPDDGGADDWNDSCFPTPGLRNARGSFGAVNTTPMPEAMCPFSDIAPYDFVFAECNSFGKHIWRPAYWDDPGWLNGQSLPAIYSKWDVFAD